jgi:sugar lactone lactonase YvrE
MTWQTVVADTYALGESPFWHPGEQRLYWVDGLGKLLLRVQPGVGAVEAWPMPSEPGCMAPAAGGGLVVALRHGVFRARVWGGPLELIATLPYDTTTVRANDGKCDPLGRFWVGTLDETKLARSAALFSIDARPSATVGVTGNPPVVQRMAGDATTANGLAWSPDARTLYWADTPGHVVHAWDWDGVANTLSAHRTFLQCPPKPADWTFDPDGGAKEVRYGGRPDGAAVDVLGNYWVAMYEGARVCQFAPDGSLLANYPTPVQCPTMPCFGGGDLKTLYLTSARSGRGLAELKAMPQSGGVFSMRVAVPGLPVNSFVD